MQWIEIQYCARYLLKGITFRSISRLQVFHFSLFYFLCVSVAIDSLNIKNDIP